MLTAEVAAYATTDILIAYIDTLHINTVFLKDDLHFTQTAVGAPMQMRTTVDNQYFHQIYRYLFNFIFIQLRSCPTMLIQHG